MPWENASRKGSKKGMCGFCLRYSLQRSEKYFNKRSWFCLSIENTRTPIAEISANSKTSKSAFCGIAVNIPCQRERCSAKVIRQISARPSNIHPLIWPSSFIFMSDEYDIPKTPIARKAEIPRIKKKLKRFLVAILFMFQWYDYFRYPSSWSVRCL